MLYFRHTAFIFINNGIDVFLIYFTIGEARTRHDSIHCFNNHKSSGIVQKKAAKDITVLPRYRLKCFFIKSSYMHKQVQALI